MSDFFEYGKDNDRSQILTLLRGMPIVSYGYVVEVIDQHYVRVAPIIQDNTDFARVCDVTLLGLSSALFEVSIAPQVNDLVLLLSPGRFNAGMFDEVDSRGEGNQVIYDSSTRGYSSNALVGILMSTIKSVSALSIVLRKEGETNKASIESNAETDITMLEDVNIGLVSGDGTDKATTFVLSEHRPATIDLRSARTTRVGFNGKEEEEAIEAPTTTTYSELAPVTESYGGARTIKVGFDGIPDSDEPTDAPTEATYSEKAPVNLSFGAPITIAVSPDNTDAPVDITLGQKAELTIASGAGIAAEFQGPISFTSKATELVTLGNSIATLVGILDEYNDILSNFDTTGSPAAHVTGPGAKAKLVALKQKQDKVFG